jgi:hypothetical protein
MTVNVLCDISHIQIDLARHPFRLEDVLKHTLAQTLPLASSMNIKKAYSIWTPRHNIERYIDFRIGPICPCAEYRLTSRDEW